LTRGEVLQLMESKEIIEHIDKLVFFKEFTSEEKANVTSFTQNFVLFRGGDLIIKQDSNDPSLYILLYGEVELRKNEQPNVVISTLLPGSIFGTIPALPLSPPNKNVIAIKKVWSWERGEILRITSTYGIIKVELDKTPSLSEETRITSNLMYEQLKNIQRQAE